MTRATLVDRLKNGWWIVSLVSAMLASMGTTWLSPAARISKLERHDALQDTLIVIQRNDFERHVADKQRTLEQITERFDRFLAGQCAKERDRMARLAYGCPSPSQIP